MRGAGAVLVSILSLLLLGATPPETDYSRPGVHGSQELLGARAVLSDATLDVDVFRPATGEAPFPAVVVAHGLAGKKEDHRGWGRHLASWGFVAVVPQFPSAQSSDDHTRNSRHLRELLDTWIPAQVADSHSFLHDRARTDRMALMGHSFGALATVLAAGDRPGTPAVLLDLADWLDAAKKNDHKLTGPSAFLFGERSWVCNQNGNGQDAISDVMVPPLLRFRVVGATHCEPADPGGTCPPGCTEIKEERRQLFRAYGTVWLRRFLSEDPDTEWHLGEGLDELVRLGRVSHLTRARIPALTVETPDGGSPPADGGIDPFDAGGEPDAGDLPDAGGGEETDGGAPDASADAGSEDAAPIPPLQPDAGDGGEDTGDPLVDAGPGDSVPAGGCDCAAGGSAPALLFALTALLARRRRRGRER